MPKALNCDGRESAFSGWLPDATADFSFKQAHRPWAGSCLGWSSPRKWILAKPDNRPAAITILPVNRHSRFHRPGPAPRRREER